MDWLPPTAWMLVIVALSTDAGSAEHTGRWLEPVLRAVLPSAAAVRIAHGAVRTAAHAGEYAVLAALWFHALRRGRGSPGPRAAWAALAIAAAWAVTDEWHQAFVPSRTASAGDVVIDVAGAALAMAVAGAGWRAAVRRATTVLLWIAALGGAGALALNAALGVSSGPLWFSTPAAVLLLARRRLDARRATSSTHRT